MALLKEYNEGVKNHGEPNTWDVTLVTDMSKLFKNMENFNAPIDQWNTSQVTNMIFMFSCALSFNQPITMDTSKVTNMSGMFCGAVSFNQPITMDTSKVTMMQSMFCNASSFNQPITMDTSKVTNMEDMFEGATAMTYPVPFLTYVIGKLGSNDLPIGTVPIPFDEIETVRKYFILRGKKMGRPMQVGDAGGGGDGWGGVPSGFCLQALKNGGDGSAHFNKNVNGDNNGLYFPVGKVPVSNFFFESVADQN